jgi:predicted DCC family thiol-disulfide oxidoreductase YuxK
LIWSRNKQTPGPETSAPVTELDDPLDLSPYFSGGKKTVVFFEMTGCPYCHAFRQRFLDTAAARSGECEFMRVRLDDPGNPLWHKLAIHAVPTVIAFANGEVLARADAVLALGLTKKKWADFCARI